MLVREFAHNRVPGEGLNRCLVLTQRPISDILGRIELIACPNLSEGNIYVYLKPLCMKTVKYAGQNDKNKQKQLNMNICYIRHSNTATFEGGRIVKNTVWIDRMD